MDDEAPTLPALPRQRNQYNPAVTRAQQRAYLSHLAATGRHVLSCQATGINDSQPFNWGTSSADFKKRHEEAKLKGQAVLLAQYEATLDAHVLDHTEKDDINKSQILRMFRMKKLDPSYRDNAVPTVNMVGPVAIQFNLALPQTPQADEQAQPDNSGTSTILDVTR